MFAVLIGIWIVHEHRIRSRDCGHGTKEACVQATKTEDGAILMGVLGGVFLVIFGGVLVASSGKMRR